MGPFNADLVAGKTDTGVAPGGGAPSGPSRRQFLAGGLGLAGALGLSGLLAACGSGAVPSSGGAGQAGAGSGTVELLGWSYFDVPTLNSAGVTAKWTPLAAAADLYTKTRRPGTFDLAMPASFQYQTMRDLNLIEPLDESRLPNLANLDPGLDMSWARGADGQLYGVPVDLFWSYVIWDKAQTVQPKTFRDLLTPELKGKVGLMDEPVTLFVLAGLTEGYDGKEITDERLDTIVGMLDQLRPQVGNLHPFGSGQELLARKEIALTIHALPPELGNARAAGVDADAAFFGSYATVDALSIVKGAKNPDAAYVYMNNFLTPTAQEAVTMVTGTAMSVAGGTSQAPDVRMFGGLANILKNSNMLGPVPAEGSGGVAGISEMARVWAQFKESL